MSEIKPFADDDSVWISGGLSVENGICEIVLHGSAAFSRDRVSLRRAKELATLLERIAASMGPEECLPEEAEAAPGKQADIVPNPFS